MTGSGPGASVIGGCKVCGMPRLGSGFLCEAHDTEFADAPERKRQDGIEDEWESLEGPPERHEKHRCEVAFVDFVTRRRAELRTAHHLALSI